MQIQITTSAQTASSQQVGTARTSIGTAIIGGLLTALAWDPWGWAVSAILGISLWWYAVQRASTPYLAGTVATLYGICWLALACAWMRVFGPIPYIALVVIEGAVIGLVGVLSWYWRTNPWRWVMVPSIWVAIEAARVAFPFGGFAWAQLSHSQANGTWMLGFAPWIGSWGLSAVIVVLGMAIVHCASDSARYLRGGLGLVVIIACGLGLRAVPNPFTSPTGRPLRTAFVQAGDVRHTFAAGISALSPKDQRVVDALVKEHRALDGQAFDLIIWPENSLDNDPDAPGNEWLATARDRLLASVGDATVLVGQNDHNAQGKLTNAIGVYHLGQRTDTITKYKLVPFGEFFPYPEYLGWVPSAQLIGHMVPGDGPGTVRVREHPVGAVICYESAYASMVSQALAADAGVLVVSTNNASFADTAMMNQHLVLSRLRAVEYGRPVIHASLSGPSAFIAPNGTISELTSYLEGAARTQTLQPRSGFTLAAWLNPVLPWVATGIALVGLGIRVEQSHRSAKGQPE